MVSRRRQQSLRKAMGFKWFIRLTAAVEHVALQAELVSCSAVLLFELGGRFIR